MNKRQAVLHNNTTENGGVVLSRKQIINGKNIFQSKNEKERSKNYTNKWINIINKNEADKINKSLNSSLYKSAQM